MARGRIKSALALVGACAVLSILLPPLAGVLNAVGSITLLALGGYSAYRVWAWLETVVEASHRPAALRRNLGKGEAKEQDRSERPAEDREPTSARDRRPGRSREASAAPAPRPRRALPRER